MLDAGWYNICADTDKWRVECWRNMSYRDLEIWKLANQLVIDIHLMTVNNLPKYEFYEEGSQIRRSSKSVKSNLVEGYGRRRYK